MTQKYLGIMPYEENSSFVFAGRSEETWLLYDRIIRNDYTVYYAASGEGKSSLIKAGLIPILRRRDFFPVYIVFNDKEFDLAVSLESIIEGRIEVEKVKYHVTYEQSEWSKQHFTNEQSNVLANCFWWKIRNYCFKRGDIELKPLFIFDQFEEVFTKANYKWTDDFFKWLEEISTDYVPDSLSDIIKGWNIEIPTQKNFKSLFSFRTEYLGDLDYWCVQKHFLPSLQENRICLKALTRTGAREVILLDDTLVEYADKIIQGCAESGTDATDEKQPCVYALILSVVCQTLDELPDSERISLLNGLQDKQDETIDDILLKFYRKKLKEVGLDYIKDESIIADIEDALVDEKGKRNRRDTDEASMQMLSKWIEKLCAKENGLLKVIGKKEVDGVTINTVEFPHDRLCKAIDSSRKERQRKLAWILNRKSEWIQFGIITVIIGIIAFLWNSLMPALNPVISGVLSSFTVVRDLFLHKYLHWEHSEYANYSLDEGFSTISLMFLLIIYIPLITIFISRKTKKWQIITCVLSFIGALSFGLLGIRNNTILFSTTYISIFTVIGFLVCSVGFVFSVVRVKPLLVNNSKEDQSKNLSFWPLWGGYFGFACYVFYEFLFRTTFGINEPCDSFWALFVLPLLYTIWSWGFFCMKIGKNKRWLLYGYSILTIVVLSLLAIISILPYNNNFKNSLGFLSSIILIVLWFVTSIIILCQIKSRSNYFILTKTKRVSAIVIGIAVLITTFFLNLGYNPFVIAPNSVCRVASWRDVMVAQIDSIGQKKLGVVYSTTGKTIVPCHIPVSPITDSLLSIGKYPFNGGRVPIEVSFHSSPFPNANNINSDRSLEWDALRKTTTGYVPVVSTLEEYLQKTKKKGVSEKSNLAESINYYAAILFQEMRNANIDFLLTNETYNTEVLKSLKTLDSLQHIALSYELQKFSLNAIDTTITIGGGKNLRPRIEVLEDTHLVDFHRELTRSFLLCLIKDRATNSDIPAMFTLANTYLLAFFTDVPSMNIISRLNVKQSDASNTINGKRNISYRIYSDDILNRRVFAWYDLFNSMCWMDIGWNANMFEKNLTSYLSVLKENVESLNEVQNELLNVLHISNTSINDIVSSSKSSIDSVAELTDYLGELLKISQPEYYESILERLDNINYITNIVAIDESLSQLKKDVLCVLLPIMKERPMCIYNNDFENVCKNLILVSAFRSNDINDDMKAFSDYLSEKNSFYNLTEKIINEIGNTSQLQEMKIEIKEQLKEIITLLKVKQ